MKTSLQTLRPVGNPIVIHKEQLNYTQFGGFNIDFYHTGTAALAAAILAIKKLSSKNNATPEIILPAYACPDLISAVLYAGAKPVLVDLDPDSCWMSLEQIENNINEQTIAIIAVRFLGIVERMGQLHLICEKNNLVLIEDSAQGFPLDNPDTYWQGDVIILSFGRGKPINMLGGGAVLTKKEIIKTHLPTPLPQNHSRLDIFKYILKAQMYNYLIKPSLYGLALKLPGLNVGETTYKKLGQIEELPHFIFERLNANIGYFQYLSNTAVEIENKLQFLRTPHLIDLPHKLHHDFKNSLLRYPLLASNKQMRDVLHKILSPFGSSIMYRKPLYKIEGLPKFLFKQDLSMINSENFSKRLITLPTHKDVTAAILNDIFIRIESVLT